MSDTGGLGLPIFLLSIAAIAGRGTKFACWGVKSSEEILIDELWLFPIKGCKGFKVTSSKMTARGLEYDRTFMLVKESSGHFVSQRGLPKMALLETSLDAAGKHLVVSAKKIKNDIKDLKIPLREAQNQIKEHHNLKVTVWGQECLARDVGDDYAKWFSSVLGGDEKLRLVHMSGNEKFNRTAYNGGVVSFADQYPVLLASQESIVGLNQRLEKPIEMERFRPNVVVKGVSSPFAEDMWENISFVSSSGSTASVDEATELCMDVPFPPCGRCKVPTNDLETGVLDAGNQPTKAMMTFRSGSDLGLQQRKLCNQVYFGVHLARPTLLDGGKTELRVGDKVLVKSVCNLKRREEAVTKLMTAAK